MAMSASYPVASVLLWLCLLTSYTVLGLSLASSYDQEFTCPPPRFMAPCHCNSMTLWKQVLCKHMPDLKFLQQILYTHFLDVLVPCLKIEESPVPVLPSNAFLGARIKRVEIINGSLHTIEEDAFQGLEDSLDILIIQGNTLKEIPTKSLSRLRSLQTLSLSGNHITEVKNGSFDGLVALMYVSLSYNQIHTIEPGSFVNLVHLSLSFNRLKSLQGALRNLPEMIWIFISGNLLTTFENEFNYLPKLTTLVASENQIEILSSDLEVLFGLRTLTLSGNRIKKVKMGMFSNLPMLEQMTLAHNQITSVELGSLTRLKNLKILSLANNKITSIAATFKHLNYLLSLNLSGNQISTVGPGDLDVLINLVEVDLSHNNLKQITRQSFHNLGKTLVKLTLNNNRIHKMDRALHHLEVAREINLENNNLTTLQTRDFPCSCNSILAYLKLKNNPLECTRHMKKVLADLREIKTLSISGVTECDLHKFEEKEIEEEEEKNNYVIEIEHNLLNRPRQNYLDLTSDDGSMEEIEDLVKEELEEEIKEEKEAEQESNKETEAVTEAPTFETE